MYSPFQTAHLNKFLGVSVHIFPNFSFINCEKRLSNSMLGLKNAHIVKVENNALLLPGECL